jgi:glutamine synthetase
MRYQSFPSLMHVLLTLVQKTRSKEFMRKRKETSLSRQIGSYLTGIQKAYNGSVTYCMPWHLIRDPMEESFP